MLEDIIDFVDRNYGTVQKDARLSSNQLRTRPSSFQSICSRFRNWRLSRVTKKLEQEKKDLLREQFQADEKGVLTKSARDKLTRKTESIARLEEKVLILSREDVPSSFVASHAIKLRDKMFANLVMNGNSAYSVGVDYYDKVFKDMPTAEDMSTADSIPVVDSVPVEAMAAAADTSVDANNQALNSDDIKDVVEEAFGMVRPSDGVTPISPEEVAGVVNPLTDPTVKQPVQSEVEIPVPEVSPGAELEEDAIPTSVVEPEPDVDVQANIDSVFASAVESLGDSSKVSRNNSAAARVEHFDSEGQPVVEETDKSVEEVTVPVVEETSVGEVAPEEVAEVPVEEPVTEEKSSNEWQPLTDAYIAAAQKDLASHRILSYEEAQQLILRDIEERFGKKTESVSEDDSIRQAIEREINERYAKPADENVRDFVVVTPNRVIPPEEESLEEQQVEEVVADEVEAVEPEAKPDEGLHFDYSEVTPQEVAEAVEHETSKDGFEALKLRVEELKARQRETKKAMEEAERMAENAAERALEARRIAEERQAAYEAKVARLLDYSEALEEDCAFNEGRARIALEDAECNERFIEAQAASAQESDSLIEEIDLLISPEAVNVKGR